MTNDVPNFDVTALKLFLFSRGISVRVFRSLLHMGSPTRLPARRRGFWFGANVSRFDDAHRNHLLAIAPNQEKFTGLKIRSESTGSCGFSACPAQTFCHHHRFAEMCRVNGSDDKSVDERLAEDKLDGWTGL